MVFGIFRGDAALDGEAVERHGILLGERERLIVQRIALSDLNLGAHEVDAGDHLGDGVFDLNAGIDLDEIPLLSVGIEEEFHGAGIAVAGFLGEGHGGGTQLDAKRVRKFRGGRKFHDLLMAALHGTIALPQVQEISIVVGENLHFQVACAGDVLFEKDGGIAESGARFVLGLLEAAVEVGGLTHDAHAASTSAHGGFDDERKTDFAGGLAGLGGGAYGKLGSRQNGNAG